MDCLQIFPVREFSILGGQRAQNLDSITDTIEIKSAHKTKHDVYSIIFELIKALYIDRILKNERSFLASQTLAFKEEIFVKHLSIYLSHVVLGHSMRKIARGFELDRTSVSYACRRIEDKRDDEKYEKFISSCERLIDILAGKLVS